MSAFIVSTQTMNSVVDALRDLYFDRMRCGSTIDFGGLRLAQYDDFDKAGAALFALNVEAVRQRYGQRDPQPLFRWHPGKPKGNRAQRLKSMRCLRYQCSEGSVPKAPLYKALEEAIANYAAAIIDGLEDYKAAQWNEADAA